MNIFKPHFNIHKEIIGGITTFLTMSYIIIVNPQIMTQAGSSIGAGAALTSTVFLCFLMTLMAGIFIRLPYAVGPGMGLNSFIVYSISVEKHIPWQTTTGIILISGVLFLIISISPARKMIINSLPINLKAAISAGIGVFLAYIGAKNIGVIKPNPDLIMQAGLFNLGVFLSIVGFLIAFFLLYRKKSYAFLATIAIVTLLSILFGKTHLPKTIYSMPDFSLFFKVDFLGALKLSHISFIISILLAILFDSTATLMATSESGKFYDEAGLGAVKK